ncbi:hypothetical protein AB1L88_17255 [Tautonia sp. JC769]|uniref:hypothetical protein n=1 Tax=Tautonia sp. JC769 TaxID=3232135 RepID=UPI003459CFCB
MLATGLGSFEPPSIAEPIVLAGPSQTLNLWESGTPAVSGDRSPKDAPERSRVTVSFPWRVTSWLVSADDRPGKHPPIPGDDVRFEFDPELAKPLPSTRLVEWEGAVVVGEGGHLFRLALAPGTRALSFSYAVRFENRFDAGVAALRVSLRDAEGALIDAWWLDASTDRLDARLLSLVPTEPTALYLGIEVVGPPTMSDTPVPYTLNVRQAAPPPPPETWYPGAGGSQVESPIGWDVPLEQEAPFFGVAELGASLFVNLDTRRGAELSGLELAPGRATTIERVSAGSVAASAFERGLVRPLPTQSASTVGGLLATGPDIRGEREVPDRLPRIDEFADPLLMASGPVGEGPEGADRAGARGMPERAGESSASGSLAELAVIPIELAAPAEVSGIAPMTGPGTSPSDVAGLRTRRGTPSILSGSHCSPPIPDDLAALVAAIEPPAGGSPEPTAGESPEDDPDPTRPRVLRTALIGAAALAVGLLLPDLTSERAVIRLRPRPSRVRWWFFG